MKNVPLAANCGHAGDGECDNFPRLPSTGLAQTIVSLLQNLDYGMGEGTKF